MLSWSQVGAWRMERQGLTRLAPADDAVEIARRLCGLHAQVMSSAELTLWARVEDLPRDRVAQLLWQDRALVKTWAMRGTLHLLPADELGLWHAATGTFKHFLKPSWLKAFGFADVDELETLIEAIGASLDGQPLTREQLGAAVTAHTGSAALGDKLADSWGSIIKPAAFRGRLCFGPSDGQKVTFTSPSAWVGSLEPAAPEVALPEITRRYLTAYGPATREDYGRWWAVPPPEALRRIKAAGAVEVDVEGTRHWALPEHVASLEAAAPAGHVRLVPAFDQYVVSAGRAADGILAPDRRAAVYRPQGWLTPVLLVDGIMRGVWRHERKGKRLTVSIEPFGRVTRKERAAGEAEAERLRRFVGGELAVSWAGGG